MSDQVTFSFRLASDWLRAWHEFSRPITDRSIKQNQSNPGLPPTLNWYYTQKKHRQYHRHNTTSEKGLNYALPPVTMTFFSLQKSNVLTPLYTLNTVWSLSARLLGCMSREVKVWIFFEAPVESFNCDSTWVLPIVWPENKENLLSLKDRAHKLPSFFQNLLLKLSQNVARSRFIIMAVIIYQN